MEDQRRVTRARFARGLALAPTSSRSRRTATRMSSERAGFAFAVARAAATPPIMAAVIAQRALTSLRRRSALGEGALDDADELVEAVGEGDADVPRFIATDWLSVWQPISKGVEDDAVRR